MTTSDTIAASPVVGAVLAGGASTRMGRSKQAINLGDDCSMIDRVIEALSTVCTRVVIVGQADGECSCGHEMIHDQRPGFGPLGGIEALLASGMAPHFLVCPCDVPLITPETLRLLLMETEQPASVFRVEGASVFDPLPARIHADALPVVRRLLGQGRRAVHELMSAIGAHEVIVPSNREAELLNVNTPADLDEARRRLSLTPAAHEMPARPLATHRPRR